ncbi:38439_t:CDS:2, partial [Gigaspora margarita]
MSVDWSKDTDLEFSMREDPTDTGLTSSEERKNLLGNMKERSGKTAKNNDIMKVIMQNDDLSQNLGNNTINSEIKSSEGCQNLEQAANGISLVNQANEVLQEEANIVHTSESKKEKAVDTISVGPEEEIGRENEIIVETDIGSKQIVDNEEFIQ